MKLNILIGLLGVLWPAFVSAAEPVAPSAAGASALPAIQSVSIDARGRFVVNDKVLFPILLYDVKYDDASLQTYRQFGFNVLAVHDPAHLKGLRERGFYAALGAGKPVEAEGLSATLMSIGMDSPALNWKGKWRELLPPHTQKVREHVPGRPVMCAIGYWDDDLEGLKKNRLLGKADYEDLSEVIEVPAPYLYPVPFQPVSSVADAVERIGVATAKGGRAVLPILQIFRWSATDRYPTPAELRCMVYLSLIHGATGLGYYSYGTVMGEKGKTVAEVAPELWASVAKLNEEAGKMGATLLQGEPDATAKLAKTSAGVHFRAVRQGEGILIVVANASEAPVEIEITASALKDPVKMKLDPLGVAEIRR